MHSHYAKYLLSIFFTGVVSITLSFHPLGRNVTNEGKRSFLGGERSELRFNTTRHTHAQDASRARNKLLVTDSLEA